MPRKRFRRLLQVVVGPVVVTCAVFATAACGSVSAEDYDWSRPSVSVLPDTIDSVTVDKDSPSASGMLEQLKQFAPQVEGTAAALSDEGADTVLLFTMNGPQNSLNSVQLVVARSVGGGAKPDAWRAQDPSNTSADLTYQKTTNVVDGVSTTQVSSVDPSGTAVERWTFIRPTETVLLMVRDTSGRQEQTEKAVATLLQAGQK